MIIEGDPLNAQHAQHRPVQATDQEEEEEEVVVFTRENRGGEAEQEGRGQGVRWKGR